MADRLDPEKLKDYLRLLFSKLEGAMTSGMVHLGDRLGLYKALAAAGGPTSSHDLATATGLHERWVREWLHNQAAAGLVAFADGDGGERFWMTPEARAATLDERHPAFALGMFHQLPQMHGILDQLPEAFRTGVGLPYDAFGPEGAAGIERNFAPWYHNFLIPVALPALDGVVGLLRKGARVADVGCGTGLAVLTMAREFPDSEFHGYDISVHALERAEANRVAAGVVNAHFHDARVEPLPSDGSVDFVTTFDCLHDMTDPATMIAAIRRALAPDGSWLIADIRSAGSLSGNIAENPMASMMYGVSVLTCMSSAMSEPGGMGLGTLGFHEQVARDMTAAGGFTRFRRLDIDNPVNAFYEVRA